MSFAVVEFLLTDRPVHIDIELENDSMLENLLPMLEKRFFSLTGRDREGRRCDHSFHRSGYQNRSMNPPRLHSLSVL